MSTEFDCSRLKCETRKWILAKMDFPGDTVYYLAGPMSGIAQFNFPAFNRATEDLRNNGYIVISPAEMDDSDTKAQALASPFGKHVDVSRTWGDFLSRDVKMIADEAKGLILLPGWHTSRGARLEAFVALLCKHEIREYYGWGRTVPIPNGDVAELIVKEFT